MFAIYLIVAVFVLAYSFYYAGQWERDPKANWHFFDDEADILKCGFLVGLFWPFVLSLAIMICPLALFYYLGEKRKAKRKAKN
jgi:hypothetical protein